MNLRKKKNLTARALGVGKQRIAFVNERKNEIKDAITKADIRDLVRSGAIKIKEIKGRKKVETRKRKRGPGKVKKKLNNRKAEYVIITRKLRGYVKGLYEADKIDRTKYHALRKRIKNREFANQIQIKEYIKTQ